MINDVIIPPGFILIIAGLLLPLLKGQLRNIVLLAAPILASWLVWALPDGESVTAEYLDYDLVLVKTDALARLFATVFCLAMFAGGLFAVLQEKTRELAAALIYAGASICVVFAGDLISLFIFWEIMAVASTIVVWAGGESARAAGLRYATIHFFGGVLLMAGIAGEIALTGSTAIGTLTLDSWPRWLILAGFLVNAGAPPFSSWLPDAYPSASWSGAVFLSAFTTKTAVYVIMRTFPGTELLIYLGLFMVFYGIIYAILENDLRRILVYSIVNQVGFMLIGIGIGTELALNGAAAHAFVHIIYKAVLLMSAGAVMYRTGKTKCTELGGLFRTMPLTAIAGIIGGLSISAFPYTSGFITKSMISQSAADAHIAFVWFSLTTASAGAFLYVGLKFPWFTFFQEDRGLRPKESPISMQIAMSLMAGACILLGVFPSLLYDLLPYEVTYVPYSFAHVVFQLQLLLFAGLAFFILLPVLKPGKTITLDFDWLYRGAGRLLAKEFNSFTFGLWKIVSSISLCFYRLAGSVIRKLHGPGGVFTETWPTGIMAFWTTVLLGVYLFFYFL